MHEWFERVFGTTDGNHTRGSGIVDPIVNFVHPARVDDIFSRNLWALHFPERFGGTLPKPCDIAHHQIIAFQSLESGFRCSLGDRRWKRTHHLGCVRATASRQTRVEAPQAYLSTTPEFSPKSVGKTVSLSLSTCPGSCPRVHRRFLPTCSWRDGVLFQAPGQLSGRCPSTFVATNVRGSVSTGTDLSELAHLVLIFGPIVFPTRRYLLARVGQPPL